MKAAPATTTTAAALLLLTSCFPTPRHTSEPEPTEPVADCLTVSTEAQASLQKHLDAKLPDQTINEAAAVLSPNATDDEPAWFVAANVDSQGDNVTAIWFTVNDPTEPTENAFLSVDAMAEVISDYARPDGASIVMEGAQQAEACLN